MIAKAGVSFSLSLACQILMSHHMRMVTQIFHEHLGSASFSSLAMTFSLYISCTGSLKR